MNENNFFFDKHVSLYYHSACFIGQISQERAIIFVRIRNQQGDLEKQVTVKDFGERISPDYLQIGYNFNNVRPFLVVKGK